MRLFFTFTLHHSSAAVKLVLPPPRGSRTAASHGANSPENSQPGSDANAKTRGGALTHMAFSIQNTHRWHITQPHHACCWCSSAVVVCWRRASAAAPGRADRSRQSCRDWLGIVKILSKKRLRVHFIFAYFGLSVLVHIRTRFQKLSCKVKIILWVNFLMCECKGTGKLSSYRNGQKHPRHDFPKKCVLEMCIWNTSSVQLENTFKSHKVARVTIWITSRPHALVSTDYFSSWAASHGLKNKKKKVYHHTRADLQANP